MTGRTNNKEVFLHPGQFHFGDSKQRIGTLLGSCIAICLWHPKLKIGGMCHFVLPSNKHSNSTAPNGRYAPDAMELFRRAARGHRTKIKEYQAMIYGGANVVAALASNEEDTIGMRNAGIAMELLMAEGASITVVDVGETWSRRISFDISTGQVDVKKRGTTFAAK